MPIKINGVRYWDDSEYKRSYDHGRQDGGDKSNSRLRYTEEDLKTSFDQGIKSADELLGSAVRAGYEDGQKAGLITGKKEGELNTLAKMPRDVHEAKKIGFNEGHNVGYGKGRLDSEFIFQKNAESHKQAIIEEYQQTHSFSARTMRLYDEFMEAKKTSRWAATLNLVGKLPVGFLEEGYDTRIYRLSDFRRAPSRVLKLFTLSYILLPVIGYQVLKYPYQWIKDWRDQTVHGETDAQFQSRKLVEKRCQELDKLTSNEVNLKQLAPKHMEEITQCKIGCKEALTSYERMLTTMNNRQKLNIGNQTAFGPRTIGGHQDTLKKDTQEIIATRGIDLRIEALFNELTTSEVPTSPSPRV